MYDKSADIVTTTILPSNVTDIPVNDVKISIKVYKTKNNHGMAKLLGIVLPSSKLKNVKKCTKNGSFLKT